MPTIPHLLALLPLLPLCTPQSTLPKCHYTPTPNASLQNYPSSPSQANTTTTPPLYNLTLLSAVPLATTCYTTTNSTLLLTCARQYIDAIDEQLAFLYARRLGFAAVAGNAKFEAGQALNDKSRNEAVAEGMAGRVGKYGGSAEAGRVLGGEGCMIFASLEVEVESIEGVGCGGNVTEAVERVC